MRRLSALFPLVALVLAGSVVLAQDDEGNPPRDFDQYWMVFLVRGDDPPELDEAAGAELQRKHLAHLSKVWRSGHALVAGPFEVPEDEPMRGIVIYRGDLAEAEVRELAEADPAVQAGRLKVDVRRWWTGANVMEFRGVEELEGQPLEDQELESQR